MTTQDVRVEALLNIRCIVKSYHLCRYEVNVRATLFPGSLIVLHHTGDGKMRDPGNEVDVGEGFTANKTKGERRNVFKVVNHRRQLGHPQYQLVDPPWPLHAGVSVSVNFFIKTVTNNLGKQI